MKTVLMRLSALMATCLILSFGASAQDRIVSVGGDVTEIIYALGEGDRIAATDSTSVYPLKALATPKVGYVRNLSAEGVLSVEPDLILISGAAGPADALDQIRATGVPMVEMETEYTVDAILEKTQRVADAIGVSEKGAALAATIEAEWTEAQLTSAAQNDRVFMVDAVTVMQFSPRTPKAAGRLAAEIKARLDSADAS